MIAVLGESHSSVIEFSNVTESAGLNGFRLVCGSPEKNYIIETVAGGAAFLDYNNDGWLDIYLVNGSKLEEMRSGRLGHHNRLYRNQGDGTFEDVTASSGTGDQGWGMGVSAADVDGDGWVDIYVTNYGPNVFLLNNGDETFRAVDRGLADDGFSTGAAFADVDRDGDLDLYVANYVEFDIWRLPPPPGSNRLCKFRGLDVMCGPLGLRAEPDRFYRQEESGVFVEATSAAQMVQGPSYGLGVVWGDYNNDGWPDLYVANDSRTNLLFVNRGDGTFSEDGLMSGLAVSGRGGDQAGMGVDAGDYNNDGWLDLYVTNFSHDHNTLYVNQRDGSFSDMTVAHSLSEPTYSYLGWGTSFVDFDNDGWLDIFVANGHVYPQAEKLDRATRYRQPAQCFLNQRGMNFVEVAQTADLTPPVLARGAAFGDYDNDGDIDVLMNCMEGPPVLLKNVTTNKNHWVQFLLRGSQKNLNAVGARVELKTPGRILVREVKSGNSYLSQSDFRIHFGLGPSAEITKVNVRWPDGSYESFEGVRADHRWSLKRGTGKAALR